MDFLIDDQPTYTKIGDLITPLGWMLPSEHQKAVNRFLLIESADFPGNRRSIYVCPECGELGCGAVSAVIEKVENQIIWRDFGYQNNYEPNIFFDDYKNFGPFAFDVDEYTKILRQAEPLNS